MSVQENAAATLKAREWLAVTIVIASLACLAALTQFKGNKPNLIPAIAQIDASRPTVEVVVKGAVSLPGTYHLPQEMTLGALLELAKPLPEADLGKWRLEAPIRKGRLVVVKEREQITVYLSGAVKNEGAVKVMKGTTLEQLLQNTELDAQADVGAIKAKRKLRANELIEIPFRKVL